MNDARHFGFYRSDRHELLANEYPPERPSWLEAARSAAARCNGNCNQGRACDCVVNVEENAMLSPNIRSTRARWRDMHFARRLGETVPDATYSCALERPRPGRIREWLRWAIGIGLIFAALTAPHWWPK